ncbi:hypothetical protein D3C81_1998180 [compost metagenome]
MHFNLCRNYDHLKYFNLISADTIVNNSDKTQLSWNTLTDYKKYTDLNERFLKLSSQSAIKAILQYCNSYLDLITGGVD